LFGCLTFESPLPSGNASYSGSFPASQWDLSPFNLVFAHLLSPTTQYLLTSGDFARFGVVSRQALDDFFSSTSPSSHPITYDLTSQSLAASATVDNLYDGTALDQPLLSPFNYQASPDGMTNSLIYKEEGSTSQLWTLDKLYGAAVYIRVRDCGLFYTCTRLFFLLSLPPACPSVSFLFVCFDFVSPFLSFPSFPFLSFPRLFFLLSV